MIESIRRMSENQFMTDMQLVLSVCLNVVMILILRLVGNHMYQFFIVYYLWLIVFATLPFILLRRQDEVASRLKRAVIPLSIVVLLTIIVRLAFLGVSENPSLDALWYLDFGRFMMNGQIPYTDFYFPYPPVFTYFIFMVSSFAPTLDAFRLLAAISDGVLVIVLWKLAEHHLSDGWHSAVALTYAFFPASIIESGWNGHFEPLANVFMLLALWFMFQDQQKRSGACLALGAATKAYPLVLAPVVMFRFSEWRKRAEFLLAALVAGALTFFPWAMQTWIRGESMSVFNPSDTSMLWKLFDALFGYVMQADSVRLVVILLGTLGIAIGTILLLYHLVTKNPRFTSVMYYGVFALISVVLVAMGAIVAVYPLLPFSRVYYWRYPLDVAIARGAVTSGIGMSIFLKLYRESKRKQSPKVFLDEVFLLTSSAFLLVLAFSRDVFYGWYILWCIPILLVLRSRHLAVVAVLCLLIVYPSYTYDNFTTLGIQEQRKWSNDFDSAEGWVKNIQIQGDVFNESLIHYDVYSENGVGHFRVDASRVENQSYLANASITFTKSVSCRFSIDDEAAVSVSASWDPTFGVCAHFSLLFSGFDMLDSPIQATIIPRTGLLTNLTFIHWRYSFMVGLPGVDSGVIRNISIVMYPQTCSSYEYLIDFVYTTYAGFMKPIYFVTVPLFVVAPIAAYVLIEGQLRKHRPVLE